MLSSPGVSVLVLVLSALSYVFGGYLAAFLSPSRPAAHALLGGSICLVIGAIGYLGVMSSPYPIWTQAVGFGLTLPCCLLGANWHSRFSAQPV